MLVATAVPIEMDPWSPSSPADLHLATSVL
jgi:hypothetical protein